MVDVADTDGRIRGGKSASAFRTISEVSAELDVPQHVLRFWETKFPQIKPLKRGGGRRYYRPDDVELLRRIQSLLYKEGYTIKGVQRLLKESRGGPLIPANDGVSVEEEGGAPASAHPPSAQPAPPPARGLFDPPSTDAVEATVPVAPAPRAVPQPATPAAEVEATAPVPVAHGLPEDKRQAVRDVLEELLAIRASLGD